MMYSLTNEDIFSKIQLRFVQFPDAPIHTAIYLKELPT
jgi:hypothetical protein